MTWQTPSAINFRFGFEINLYVSARSFLSMTNGVCAKAQAPLFFMAQPFSR